jgi:hypothetical protein
MIDVRESEFGPDVGLQIIYEISQLCIIRRGKQELPDRSVDLFNMIHYKSNYAKYIK